MNLNFFNPANGEGDYEETKTVLPNNIALFEPTNFEASTDIALALKQGKSAVINLTKLQREYAQRTIDFLTGVCYSLDGRIEKIGHNLILCAPKNVALEGVITLGE